MKNCFVLFCSPGICKSLKLAKSFDLLQPEGSLGEGSSYGLTIVYTDSTDSNLISKLGRKHWIFLKCHAIRFFDFRFYGRFGGCYTNPMDSQEFLLLTLLPIIMAKIMKNLQLTNLQYSKKVQVWHFGFSLLALRCLGLQISIRKVSLPVIETKNCQSWTCLKD